jgi:hypothetical protein
VLPGHEEPTGKDMRTQEMARYSYSIKPVILQDRGRTARAFGILPYLVDEVFLAVYLDDIKELFVCS